MITLRKSEDRGQGSFGWLNSKHTFSFGQYYDPNHMGFSELRVINDDIVKPGAGFETHGHKDMEIISYVIEGSIDHKDSEGHVQSLPAGEFQLMSAGSGIYHSEYNGSKSDSLRFLQIWIQPNSLGNPPVYQQKNFGEQSGLTTIVTPDGKEGTLQIKQDAYLYQLILEPKSGLDFSTKQGRRFYVHQIKGKLLVNNEQLHEGDGAMMENESNINLTNEGQEKTVALIFDLP